MMVLRGKMKRAYFCCLRGGHCTVDVNNRKKCNFCRFEKCKLVGMVPDFKELKNVKEESSEVLLHNKQEIKEEESIGDEFELVARNQHESFEIFVTNQSVNPFFQFPKTPNYKFGPEELGKLHFFVDLWHVQKWVQPLGLPYIIPLLDCLKNKKSFSKDVITTHIKVGQSEKNIFF